MAKHDLEGVSVVWCFMLILTLCRVYMHQNGSDGYFSFTFFLVAGIKVEKKLRTKTWLGRRFCCLVIFANLHNLPCICVKMAPTGTFFRFLVIVGIKGEKRKLRTCQDMVWKAFLLFGDVR